MRFISLLLLVASAVLGATVVMPVADCSNEKGQAGHAQITYDDVTLKISNAQVSNIGSSTCFISITNLSNGRTATITVAAGQIISQNIPANVNALVADAIGNLPANIGISMGCTW